MQEKDVLENHFISDNNRFADVFNVGVFGGLQLIRPDRLWEVDRTSAGIFGRKKPSKKREKKKAIAKYRDVVKEFDRGIGRIILAVENQTNVHYAMPVRTLMMDALDYHSQAAQIKKMHENERDVKGAEFLSGFSKKDKLKPVITTVIYYGEKPWDGPKALHDILDMEELPKEMMDVIPDYPLRIIDVRRLENIEDYQTDVGLVFGFLKYAEDKEKLAQFVEEHAGEFSQVQEDAYDVIFELTASQELSTMKENIISEGGTVNMCEGLRGMIEDGKLEGEIEGKAKEQISLIQKKLAKNMDISVIADFLEVEISYVEKICKIIKEHPEYTVDEIYKAQK